MNESASLGVHQFYGLEAPADNVQVSSQYIVANLIQFIFDMGIGIEALHIALKTSPSEMYVFSKAELARFKLTGKSPIIAYGTTFRDGCPFPLEFDLHDPMGLYPQCH